MKRTTFFKDTSRGFVVRAGLRVNSPLCFVNCVWELHLSPVSLGLQELSQDAGKGCGCTGLVPGASLQLEVLNAVPAPEQLCRVLCRGWAFTSVLLNKMKYFWSQQELIYQNGLSSLSYKNINMEGKY